MSNRCEPVTAADCIAAIRSAGTIEKAGQLLGVSGSLIYGRLRYANIDLWTLEPKLPLTISMDERTVILRELVKKALELGIWHVDQNGDVQQWREDDPWKGRCPNLLDRNAA